MSKHDPLNNDTFIFNDQEFEFDANGDGAVDGADFAIWQRQLPQQDTADGDGKNASPHVNLAYIYEVATTETIDDNLVI